MRTTRRILTLALAALMVLVLAIPAFATPGDGRGGTIKIEGAVLEDTSKYTTYTIYKMFDVEDGNDADENKYRVTDEWVDFVKQDALKTYFVVQVTADGTYMIWNKNTASTADAAAIAELARDYVSKNQDKIGYVDKVTVNGEAKDVEDNGYYLLVPSNSTASGVIVVKNEQAKVITEKSVAPGMPTVEKKVYEDSLQAYADRNTVDIGEKITYKVTITAGQGASNYILHDAMDDHIQVDYDSGSITRDGNKVAAGEFEIKTENICKGCSFHIEFNEKWCNGLNDGTPIVLTYEAKLLYQDAEGNKVETDKDHQNTAWLTHTAQNVETPKSTVSTQTREINVVKKDQDKLPLQGAGFVLKDNEGRCYKLDESTGVVSWVPETDNPTVRTSDAEGKLNFYGVDAEIFTLDEVVVPGGYTGIDGTSANVRNSSIKAGNQIEVIEIINTLGSKLPETGGIGTTVFYILGAALVMGTLAVLVVMKRKETNAQ